MSNISSVTNKSGTVIFTGANSYAGTTAITGGTTYVNNGSGSGTGTGKVTVSGNAAFGGSGTVKPGSGNGVTLAAPQLADFRRHPNQYDRGPGFDPRQQRGQRTILDASVGSANLTFSLGAGNSNGAGTYDFTNPNKASTYLTVYGGTAPAKDPLTGGQLAFAAGDTITLTDLTSNQVGGFGSGASTLKLNLSVPYLLIQALPNAGATPSVSDNDFYSGLTTTGGFDANGVLQNGYVTTPLTLEGTALVGFNADRLYLYDGELEIVPEPGEWAMMLGGFALLIFIQVRRGRGGVIGLGDKERRKG